MARQVEIELGDCSGCESCVEICPDVFAFNDTLGKAEVIKAEGGDEKAIEEAIASCPAGCITFE